MNIQILQLVDGAKQARGLAVVIDVFRAFSTACYATGQGAEKIIAVGDLDTAFSLKKKHPEYILMGERDEKIVSGFDFGNSPSQIEHIDFTGKTIVHTTSSGTQGLVSVVHADKIITGSFVNANAIVRYIQANSPEQVSLVCMGYATERPVEEDTYCAEYIRNSLQGLQTDYDSMTDNIRETSGARFFLADSQDHAPSTDFYLCLDLDRFDFVLQATQLSEGIMQLDKKTPLEQTSL
jgi:2-phosphosulfolactate phosphatase